MLQGSKQKLASSLISKLFLVLALTLTVSQTTFARSQKGQPGSQQSSRQTDHQVDHPGEIQNDAALVEAVRIQKNEYYVEAGNLVVSEILPDDTTGLPHQKWQATLSNGSKVMIVYNSDMGARVPINTGDKFAVGGQFIWTPQGGLVHWVHDDPKKQRPDGYVFFNGVVYGDIDNEDTHH